MRRVQLSNLFDFTTNFILTPQPLMFNLEWSRNITGSRPFSTCSYAAMLSTLQTLHTKAQKKNDEYFCFKNKVSTWRCEHYNCIAK